MRLPVIFVFPLTCNKEVGFAILIPTLPLLSMRILSFVPVRKYISPVLLVSLSATIGALVGEEIPPAVEPTPAEGIKLPSGKYKPPVPISLIFPLTKSLSVVGEAPIAIDPVTANVETLKLAPSSTFLAIIAYMTLLTGSLGESLSLST